MSGHKRHSIRCAIYTRKSSEEGLDQEFNSLDAQREACEAYINSQKHEGWKLVKTRYDDGGFSGGSLERPALQQLLEEVERGAIDVVVVYKVDRLTRSLLDFSKIVERFDRNSVSFVAVTQHFNTTSSMGRLTLNVLLSFAQFEREVTGERIRDKFAASKKKGMWMGGTPPLGYDIGDRKLIVNEKEAEQVREIYRRYLKCGNVRDLMHDLNRSEIRSKSWVSRQGIRRGGNVMGRGALYRMLQNRLYLGEVAHKGNVYPGEHEAILPRDLWNQVQERLQENRVARSNKRALQSSALLEGLLTDDRGNAMVPHYTKKKNGTKYRYYVSSVLLFGGPNRAGSVSRVPVGVVDDLVDDRSSVWFARNMNTEWQDLGTFERRAALRKNIQRIELHETSVRFYLHDQANSQLMGLKKAIETSNDSLEMTPTGPCVTVSVRVKKRSGTTIIVAPDGNGSLTQSRADATLVRNLAKAFRWRERLESGDAQSILEIARETPCEERYVRRMLRLAFLAPDIIEAIVDGRQPRHLTLHDLNSKPLPLSWEEQRRTFGFSAAFSA